MSPECSNPDGSNHISWRRGRSGPELAQRPRQESHQCPKPTLNTTQIQAETHIMINCATDQAIRTAPTRTSRNPRNKELDYLNCRLTRSSSESLIEWASRFFHMFSELVPGNWSSLDAPPAVAKNWDQMKSRNIVCLIQNPRTSNQFPERTMNAQCNGM